MEDASDVDASNLLFGGWLVFFRKCFLECFCGCLGSYFLEVLAIVFPQELASPLVRRWTWSLDVDHSLVDFLNALIQFSCPCLASEVASLFSDNRGTAIFSIW